MSNKLHIGKGKHPFALPLELVTSTQAILARKRSGKSYTASVQAEELLEHEQQIIVFDPTSAWYGLRSSADGTGVGYPIAVFGGDHADAPLDHRTGKAMAAAVVEHGFSAIFDIGNLHTEEQVQFVMDFSSELLRINRSALHVFMDEADTFAPQKPLGFLQNKCLGTVSRLVKQGGIRGIGFTMITQRPASMNKDVLSQVDILTVLRMSHPLDIKAATDWIKSEVTVEFAKTVETALPGLPVGTAFFCSASLHLGERVEVRARNTFNSGATPKPGERKAEPTVMYGIDIEKLGKEISESVKRTKEESPEFLKQRVRELEAEIAKGGTVNMGFIEEAQAAQAELERLRVEVAIIPELQGHLEAWEKRVKVFALQLDEMCRELVNGLPPIDVPIRPAVPTQIINLPTPPVGTISRALTATPRHQPAEGINAPQQNILDAMATLYAMRHANVTIEWIAATAGTTSRARGFEENLRQLKNKGLVEGIRLTPAGVTVAQAVSTPATFRATLERLAAMLPSPQLDILRSLKVSRTSPSDLAAAMGTTERARGFEENVRQLRKKNLIEFRGGVYALASWLEALA